MTDTNNTPTLEDVDAELTPKGLRVLEWDRKEAVWLGDWFDHPSAKDTQVRLFNVVAPSDTYMPRTLIAMVWKDAESRWHASATQPFSETFRDVCPTPEAAPQACEAAIVAAWRNR
jgi:hypothetical protein